jgi:hypothetical protein
MRKFVVMIFVLVMLAATFAVGQDSQYSVFGGWQYASLDTTQSLAGRQNTVKGWDGDFAYNASKNVSLVADFSGQYKSDIVSSNLTSGQVHAYNFLFGPRLSSTTGKVTPFTEVLIGFNHTSVGNAGINEVSKGFALAPGGGIDVKATDQFSLRVFKFDYLLDRVGFGGVNRNLNNYRISVGVVYNFK